MIMNCHGLRVRYGTKRNVQVGTVLFKISLLKKYSQAYRPCCGTELITILFWTVPHTGQTNQPRHTE